ncbi:MAG: lysine 2,3-aminomutase [Planctomycetota bacterium]
MDIASSGSDSEPGGSRYRSGVSLAILEAIDEQPANPGTAPPAWSAPPPVDRPPFVVSPVSRAFRDAHFPDASDADWCDWRWQLRHRIRNLAGLERIFSLSVDERTAVERLGDHLPVGITPYYAALMSPTDPFDPLRRTMLPVTGEFLKGPGEADDPLAEDSHMPVPGLVHRYPDRVLFLVTNFCATYCRYCTRARMVGQTGEYHFNTAQYEAVLEYIRAHPEIRDVLLSGGDPLTMHDDRIEWILSRLQQIPHVEFIRIGSKVPAVSPQRVTPELCAMLKRYHPFWLSIHFMHPGELTPEVAEACNRLADAGIPLGAQIVLTRGVNDNVDTMRRLVQGLLRIRVRPYYIYQCDPISGSAHFRTPIERGLEIMAGLRGFTTGYAVPTFVVDAPGGGGKIPIFPDTIVGRDGDDVLLRNYEGQTYRYHDPLPKADVNVC